MRLTLGKSTQANTESKWGTDRKNLVKCGDKHEAVVKFYETRDAGLRGSSVP